MKIHMLTGLITISLLLAGCVGASETPTQEAASTPRTSEGLTADVGKGESLDVEAETDGADVQAEPSQVELPADFPQDIPLPEAALISDLFTASDRVSYNVALEYPNVSDFYKVRMPANGWTLVEEDVSSSHAAYMFSKEDRSAQVEITQGENGAPTLVVISFTAP
jgi:hypothetical protein